MSNNFDGNYLSAKCTDLGQQILKKCTEFPNSLFERDFKYVLNLYDCTYFEGQCLKFIWLIDRETIKENAACANFYAKKATENLPAWGFIREIANIKIKELLQDIETGFIK